MRAGIRFDCCIFKLEIVLYSTFSLSLVLWIENLRLGDTTKIMLIVSCSALAAQPGDRQNLRTPRCAWLLAKHVLARYMLTSLEKHTEPASVSKARYRGLFSGLHYDVCFS